MQTNYNVNMATGFPGLRADTGPYRAASAVALAAIPFGRGIVPAGASGKVRLPMTNTIDLVFDADLITANVVNGAVTVTTAAGVSTTTNLTATTYATSHAATMAAIATKIDAVPGIASATVGGGSSRTITVVADADTAIALSGFTVTAGSTQAGVTYALGTTDAFFAIAEHLHKPQDSTGVAQYVALDTVTAGRQGRWQVWAEQAAKPTDPVYLRFEANGAGKLVGQFRKDSDSGRAKLLTNVSWGEATTAAGLAVLELNLP